MRISVQPNALDYGRWRPLYVEDWWVGKKNCIPVSHPFAFQSRICIQKSHFPIWHEQPSFQFWLGCAFALFTRQERAAHYLHTTWLIDTQTEPSSQRCCDISWHASCLLIYNIQNTKRSIQLSPFYRVMVALRSTAPRVFSSDDDSGVDTHTTTISSTRPKRASTIYKRPVIDFSSDEESLEYDHDEIVTKRRTNIEKIGAESGSRFIIDKIEGSRIV